MVYIEHAPRRLQWDQALDIDVLPIPWTRCIFRVQDTEVTLGIFQMGVTSIGYRKWIMNINHCNQIHCHLQILLLELCQLTPFSFPCLEHIHAHTHSLTGVFLLVCCWSFENQSSKIRAGTCDQLLVLFVVFADLTSEILEITSQHEACDTTSSRHGEDRTVHTHSCFLYF